MPAIVIFTKAGKRKTLTEFKKSFADILVDVPITATKEDADTEKSRVIIDCRVKDSQLLYKTVPVMKRNKIRAEAFIIHNNSRSGPKVGKADYSRIGMANSLDRAMRTGTCTYFDTTGECPYGVGCKFDHIS
jgi:hypothetical protein